MYPTQTATVNQVRGMLMMWWDNIWASISVSLYADFVVIFMLELGASTRTIGVRSSINSAAALAAPLLGAWLVERTAKRKRWVLWGPGGLSRVLLVAMAAIPFFLKGEGAVTAFVALAAVQAFTGSVGVPAGNSLLGDVVPVAVRGRYLGAQMTAGNLIRLAVVPLAGMLISWVGGLNGYQLAWLLAAGTGFVATWYYARIPEPACAEGVSLDGTPQAGWRQGLQALLRDRRFMWFSAINFVFNVGIQGIAPFFTVHQVEDLHFTVGTIALLTTVSTMANIVISRPMGVLVDRKGAAWVTSLSMLLVPLLPFLWIFARTPLEVGLVQAYGNLAWAGCRVAAVPILLILTPPQYRSRYIAIYNTINGVAAIVGPLIAGWIYANMSFTANAIFSTLGRGLGGLGFWLMLKTGGMAGPDYSRDEQAATADDTSRAAAAASGKPSTRPPG
ncbi:MAG: MFS transporter [Anaerolineae bacterium]